MTAPHPHTKPIAHPHLAEALDLGALLLGLALAPVQWIGKLRAPAARIAVWVAVSAAAGVLLALLTACRPDPNPPGPLPATTAMTATTPLEIS